MKSVEGIILKKTPRREADAVFTLYTKEQGLMFFMAKGVRKQEAKLKAGLDVFNWVDLFYVPAKYIPIATDFRIKDDFKIIKSDLFRLRLAHFAAGAVLKIFEPGAGEEKIWQKTFDFFSALNNRYASLESLEESVYQWCYHILDLNGLNPRAPNFKPINSANLKKRTDDLFWIHFGLTIDI